jgi:hypothetical protein
MRDKLGLMVEAMNDGLSRLIEFITIIMVKIVWVIFNFHSLVLIFNLYKPFLSALFSKLIASTMMGGVSTQNVGCFKNSIQILHLEI